jgi:type IV secretory pathway VirB10-like protein
MSMASTEKKRRYIFFCLLGLAIGAAILFVSFFLFSPEQQSRNSMVAGTRTEAVKGQAGGEASEEYNRKLESHDEQKANEALQAGDSFIPTPVGQRSSIVTQRPAAPPPPPPVAQPRVAAPPPPRNDNALKRMMEDLAALDARLVSVSADQGKIVYLHDFSNDRPVVQAGQSPISPESPTGAQTAPTGIKPGDLLYAVVETGVNSDVPSAVMATIASGPYKNSRLLGGFQRFEERLVLTFARIVLPTGEDLQLEAYAVDPSTSETSVATSVNTHFFSRWGGLIAATFLEGLGTAKRYSGAQSAMYGDGTDQMIWSTYSPVDQAWIAAGKVGEKAAGIFERNFDRPPTVYLAQGTPVGVLVLNVKAR